MILITGGGSGGHLAIAKAVLEECHKKNLKCIYVGSNNRHDKLWFENEDKFEEKYFLNATGFVDKKGIKKLFVLFKLISTIIECIKIIKKHKVTKVFSVGGYSSVSAGVASVLCFKPLYIHEQNSVFGLANKILSKFAKRTFCSFIEPYDAYPIQEKFFSDNVKLNLKKIMFIGGSNGASFINDLALNIAPILEQNEISIIHQCGDKDFIKCKEWYENHNIKAEVFAFSNDIDKYLKTADLCIARAGASTIFECLASNMPCIFIPYIYAYKNHQYYNAKFLEEKNLAYLVEQKDVNKNAILELIFSINIKELSLKLSHIEKINGAKEIVKVLA